MNTFLLIWFLVTAQGNQLEVKNFTSAEDCRTAGNEMNEVSLKAKKDGDILAFGGICYEVVLDVKAGSI